MMSLISKLLGCVIWHDVGRFAHANAVFLFFFLDWLACLVTVGCGSTV